MTEIVNRFHGTDDELLSRIRPLGSVKPAPVPEPGTPMPKIVSIDMQVPEGVAVHVKVNGREIS